MIKYSKLNFEDFGENIPIDVYRESMTAVFRNSVDFIKVASDLDRFRVKLAEHFLTLLWSEAEKLGFTEGINRFLVKTGLEYGDQKYMQIVYYLINDKFYRPGDSDNEYFENKFLTFWDNHAFILYKLCGKGVNLCFEKGKLKYFELVDLSE